MMQERPISNNHTTANNKTGKARALPFIILGLLLTLGCCVFFVLCLYYANIPLLSQNIVLFSALICLLFILLFFLSVCLTVKEKERAYKTCLSVLILLLFSAVLLFVLLKTGFFNVIKDENSLQQYLEEKGAWMPIVYILLQYLQVIILPIPGMVSTLAGVALFGPFQTLVYSFVGIMLGSLTAFFIGRKVGYKAVSWIVGADTLKKWQKKLRGKDNLLLTLMFLLPLFPDDALCFIAGLSSMTTRYFLLLLTVSRFLAIALTCYSIDFIPFNTWWGLLIWGIFFAVVLISFWLVCKNLDKIQQWLSKRFKTFRKGKKRKN